MKNYKPDILCEPFMDLLSSAGASGIVSTASGLIQSGFNQLFARKNAEIQRDMQADLMHLQDRINDENLKDEREYNDPSAVASRARSAGVAPSALLGGTPGGAGISSTNRIGSGSVSAPVSNSHWPGLMTGDTIAGLRNAEARESEVESENELREQQQNKLFIENAWLPLEKLMKTENLKTQTDMLVIRTLSEQLLNAKTIEEKDQVIAKMKVEMDEIKSKADLHNAMTDYWKTVEEHYNTTHVATAEAKARNDNAQAYSRELENSVNEQLKDINLTTIQLQKLSEQAQSLANITEAEYEQKFGKISGGPASVLAQIITRMFHSIGFERDINIKNEHGDRELSTDMHQEWRDIRDHALKIIHKKFLE